MNDNPDKNEDKGQYIHFYGNKELSANFVKYISKLKYDIGHICCGGDGCKINNIDNERAIKIKKQFLDAHGINNNK